MDNEMEPPVDGEALLGDLRRGLSDGLSDAGDYEAVTRALQALVASPLAENAAAIERSLAPVLDAYTARLANDEPRLADLLSERFGAAFVLGRSGVVVHANRAARTLYAIAPGARLDALGIARADFDAAKARLGEAGSATLLLAQLPGSAAPALLAIGPLAREDGFLVTAVGERWPEGLDGALEALFGLTERERAVLAGLARGEDAAAMADAGGRSIGTVRQQIKAVLAKLGVGSQARAVALVAAAAAALDRYAHLDRRETTPSADIVLTDFERDGRRVGLRRWGVIGGLPVLFFHGALYGIGETAIEREAARAAGLSILAPERPGYGRTTLSNGTDVLDVAIADAVAALDAAGVARVVVKAHDVGCVFAFHFAAAHPERVAGIVCAPTTPPMRSWSQTADMPQALRIHAWAAQRAPRLVDALVAIGWAHLRKKGVDVLPSLAFAGCEDDAAAWNSPGFAASVAGSYALMAEQDGEGFKADMRLTNLDWSALAPRIACPALLVHGALSRTVSRSAVEALAGGLTRAELALVADAGHTVALTHAEPLARRIVDFAVANGLGSG